MQNTVLTVAEARLAGRILERYKDQVAAPTPYIDVRAFAQLRVRTITGELHVAALAEYAAR